jgi:WD40 repeat protein
MSTSTGQLSGVARSLRDSPYVGLTHFTEEDSLFFFGREAERRIILANLMASRLTLVYGPSGVGKSSLLRAGVVRDVQTAAHRALKAGKIPESIGLVFSSWRDDPLFALGELIERRVCDLLGDIAPDPVPPTRHLDELLGLWTTRLDERARHLEEETGIKQPEHVELLLVLDQFEEYFVYHPGEEGAGTFASELPRAVNRRGLRANFLLSIREDGYTLLDQFEDEIPNLFSNNIRVEHLNREAAEQAIRGPVERYTELFGSASVPCKVEDDLVEAVIQQVKTGTVAFGQAGAGTVATEDDADLRVETPFLQLVMERLWADEVAEHSDALRLQSLKRLGGAQTIVHEHLGRAIDALDDDARELAASVFDRLVTPSGSKIAYLPSDLAALEDVPLPQLSDVLAELAGPRILRVVAPAPGQSEPRYEIFHDVLAAPILEWRARYEQEQNQQQLARDLAQQEVEAARQRAAARRFRGVAVIASALAIAAVALAVWANDKQRDATRATKSARTAQKQAVTAQKQARANADVSRASVLLPTDPAAALKLGLKAFASDPQNEPALGVLRQAALSSHLISVLRRESPVVEAAFAAGTPRVVTVQATGVVDLWNGRTGKWLQSLDDPNAADGRIRAVFSSDGRRLAVEHRSGPSEYSTTSVTVWDTVRAQRLATLRLPPGVLAFSPDGRLVAHAPRPTRGLLPTDRARISHAVRLWSVTPAGASARRPLRWDRNTPEALGFSRDGTSLTSASLASSGAIWNLRTGRRVSLQEIASFPAFATDVVYSRSGSLVATRTEDGLVRVFNVRTGRLVGSRLRAGVPTVTAAPGGGFALGGSSRDALIWRSDQIALVGHTDAVNSIAFSADGTWAVTASSDRTVRVWDAKTGELRGTLAGDDDRVSSAVFSPDGGRIVEVSGDGAARLWRLPVDRPEIRLPALAGVKNVSFSGDGTYVLAASGSSVLVGPPWRRFPVPTREAAFAPDNGLVTGSPSDGVTLHNLKTGANQVVLPQGTVAVLSSLGPGRRWAAAITKGPTSVVIFDAVTGARVHVLRGTPRYAADKRVSSADGRFVATLRATRTQSGLSNLRRYAEVTTEPASIDVWNVVTRAHVFSWRQNFDRVESVIGSIAVDRVGRYVAVGTKEGAVFVWELATGKVSILQTHVPIRTLAFSPTDDLLATAGDGTSADLWHVGTDRKARKVRSLVGHTGWINSIAFSADGSAIVTASDDGTTRVWGASDGDLWAAFRQGRTHGVLDAAFDPSGSRVVVASQGGASAIYACPVCGSREEVRQFASKRQPLRP